MSNYKIQEKILNFIKKNFPNNRVICLLEYGSSLSNSKILPKDYDFLLLLDKYNKDDYKILKKAKNNLSLDLFIDYLEYINKRGFNKYQRGRHGVYFVPILANAKCLIGKNIYKENLKKVSQESIKHDLLYRIEEYFYRIQKLYINKKNTKDKGSIELIKKYLSRICTDLMLFTEEISFKKFHEIHYLDILKYTNKSKDFSKEINILLKQIFIKNDIEKTLVIIPLLYNIFFKYFKK